MLRKTRFAWFILFVLVACLSAGAAEAKIKVTVNNKTGRKIFMVLGYELAASIHTKGWYSVDAGSSKTFTIDVYFPESSFLGYYAHNIPNAGEKKLVWQSDGKGHPGKLPIHPKKAFTYMLAQGGDEDVVGPGAVEVGFRKLNYKVTGKGNISCTLTFNP